MAIFTFTRKLDIFHLQLLTGQETPWDIFLVVLFEMEVVFLAAYFVDANGT